MNHDINAVLIPLLMIWCAVGAYFLIKLDSDFGWGPVRRFLLAPAAVIIIPAVELVLFFVEE